jgi:branched-chain amino acid transport system ATP-binding protein
VTATPAVEVRGVTVRFGGNTALDEVDFAAAAGEVTGLIGPNGAGKTTLFNVISGLQAPTRGIVLIDGVAVTKAKPHRRGRLGLARTFQRLELFTHLSVRGNVHVGATIARRHRGRGRDPDRVTDELLARVGLSALADARVDELPTGQARLVELARALAAHPRVLLLDEPASGQDEAETEAFAGLLAELAAEGIAVVLVEHDMSLVMRTCSTVHVLDFGRLLASGTPEAVQRDERVQAAYLGEPA